MGSEVAIASEKIIYIFSLINTVSIYVLYLSKKHSCKYSSIV